MKETSRQHLRKHGFLRDFDIVAFTSDLSFVRSLFSINEPSCFLIWNEEGLQSPWACVYCRLLWALYWAFIPHKPAEKLHLCRLMNTHRWRCSLWYLGIIHEVSYPSDSPTDGRLKQLQLDFTLFDLVLPQCKGWTLNLGVGFGSLKSQALIHCGEGC